MRKHLLIYILMGVAIFIAGVVVAPLIEEKGYRIKEWIIKPSPPAPQLKEIKLYFSTSKGNYLFPEKRKIIASSELNKEAKLTLKELIKGPTDSSLFPTLPPQTEVRAVYIKDDCIYVDFSSSLSESHPGGSTGELLSVYSIVNTLLTDFPSQSRVQILIQGEPRETLAGHIDIREPLGKNTDIMK
ncbi:MAG: GerMN domain-containing protein [Candidatus Aerophobetes bacterium]|nr:GerMN domain-containing protein [Candidatus Aerophobetes bacterium]